MKIFQSSWLKHVKMENDVNSKKNEENSDTINHLKNFLASSKNHGDDSKENGNDSFGIDELKLVVKEYESLKDKYHSLQTEVETKLKNSDNKILKHETEINKLQNQNKSLNKEIETLKSNIEGENVAKEQLTIAVQKTIDKLEADLAEQKRYVHESNEKLSAHDAAAKRAIIVLQKEMGAKIEQVGKLYQESVSQKDAQIIKIAKLESAIDEVNQSKSNQDKIVTNQQTELDAVKSRLKAKTSDLSKIATSNESHEKEVSKLNKKIETLQEEVKSQEVKVKWAQNKLKSELDSHKETKKQITQLTNKLQQAKEEGDIIRKDCQQMIERYQGDEEIQSVRLNKELEENIAKLKVQQESLAKQEEINQERLQAIEIVNKENQRLSNELSEQKDLMMSIGEKNKELAHKTGESEKDYADMKTALEQMKDKLKEFDENLVKLSEYESEIAGLKERESKLQETLKETELEVKEHVERHQEVLQFSQNLTENNISTKATATNLQNDVDALLAEKEQLLDDFNRAKDENTKNIEQFEVEKEKILKELTESKTNAQDTLKKVNELTSSLEESKEEFRVLKKKNASQVKDLQRQLQQTTRKIEKMESTSIGSTENLSMRSRTSSCNSIEKIHQADSPPNPCSPQLQHEQPVMINQDHYINQPHRLQQHQHQQNSYPEVEIDKKVLIERVSKLQRTLAKRNEKMEFMEEHINQLTEELQKKAKIIQFYVLKEESGSLAPDRYDRVKAEACQHGGIMASVYSARQTDKNMTLDLSLAINRKLQAVLEDTILKNITLKENINTLGDVIAKLQAEVDANKT